MKFPAETQVPLAVGVVERATSDSLGKPPQGWSFVKPFRVQPHGLTVRFPRAPENSGPSPLAKQATLSLSP